MTPSRFYLSKHVFLCRADEHYVFLDLRSDEYVCLSRRHSAAIAGLFDTSLSNATQCNVPQQTRADNAKSQAVINALREKGFLASDAATGKPAAPPMLATPSHNAIDTPAFINPHIQLGHIRHFLAASATASAQLRWKSIDWIVRSIKARKATRTIAATSDKSESITKLFSVFRSLRPFYPRSYLCMFDSLALLHFLARHSIFPQWVYGVRLEPFAAHCWVQTADVVVNDTVDVVSDYTPIMSV